MNKLQVIVTCFLLLASVKECQANQKSLKVKEKLTAKTVAISGCNTDYVDIESGKFDGKTVSEFHFQVNQFEEREFTVFVSGIDALQYCQKARSYGFSTKRKGRKCQINHGCSWFNYVFRNINTCQALVQGDWSGPPKLELPTNESYYFEGVYPDGQKIFCFYASY